MSYRTPKLCSTLCKHASKKRCECQCDGLYHGRGFEFTPSEVESIASSITEEAARGNYQPALFDNHKRNLK